TRRASSAPASASSARGSDVFKTHEPDPQRSLTARNLARGWGLGAVSDVLGGGRWYLKTPQPGRSALAVVLADPVADLDPVVHPEPGVGDVHVVLDGAHREV